MAGDDALERAEEGGREALDGLAEEEAKDEEKRTRTEEKKRSEEADKGGEEVVSRWRELVAGAVVRPAVEEAVEAWRILRRGDAKEGVRRLRVVRLTHGERLAWLAYMVEKRAWGGAGLWQ